ncbi:MAG TPA: hypothetical protein VGI59_02490 [Candidatus Udaeobacter sp.]|jgi:hypothetical protein
MFPRAALVILGLILLVIVFVAVRAFTGGPFKWSADQMNTGSAYMKSLKQDDVQPWIDRTQKLLSEYDPKSQSIGVYGMGGKPIPRDLQRLKIIRIDISPDQVRYVWMGGIGRRIDLEVERLPDGSFTLNAHYSDTDSEVIWPRTPNQTLERTVDRRENLLSMTSTSTFAATLAIVSGRSACSR